MTIFLSRTLWRDLQNPPPHHWEWGARGARGTPARTPSRKSDQTALVLTFALSALALISGVILNAMVVYRVADRVARPRENDTFDLLAVTPAGGFGASWAIFAGALHYDLTLRTLRRMRYGALLLVLVVGLLSLLPVLSADLERGLPLPQSEAWSWLLFYLFLLPMMIFDHLYAVVSGGIIGILVPAVVHTEARVAALFAGAMLQFTGYLVAIITGAIMLPVVYQTIGLTGWLADLSRPLLALIVFVLVHEALALLLYRAAQAHLNGPEAAAFLPANSSP